MDFAAVLILGLGHLCSGWGPNAGWIQAGTLILASVVSFTSSPPVPPLQEIERGFSTITVVDSKNLWAVGYEGELPGEHIDVVLHSTDGGESWKRQLAHTSQHFFGIYFLNIRMGWVVGSAGTTLKTNDGGNTWVNQMTPTQATLSEIQFITQEIGWALGFDGELLRTIDGGENWRSYGLEGPGRVGDKLNGSLNSFTFRDELNGWIVGEHGQIYQSTDGGVSWQSRRAELSGLIESGRKLDVDFEAVRFFDSNRALIVAQTSVENGDDSRKTIVVLNTRDGGRNWAVSASFKEWGFVRAQFLDTGYVWIELEYGRGLLRSANGGKTWARVAVPNNVDFPLFYFLDPNQGWVVSSIAAFSGSALYTRDGGKTWAKSKVYYTRAMGR